MTDNSDQTDPSAPARPPESALRSVASRPAVRTAAVAAGLVLLTLAAYASVILHGAFVWDDNLLLTANPVIARPNGLAIIWWPPQHDQVLSRAVPDYWPLTWTTLWLECRIWGDQPTGYHVTNILLHALSAVLLWRLIKSLRLPGAVLAAAIFAVHPVCAASVAWISERKNTLSMVFYLLTLLAYARFDAGRRKRWYVLALLAFAAAMLSKTQVIMAPVVLLGLAWWRRGRVTRRDVLAAAPLLVLAAGFAVVTLWFHRQHALGLVASRPEGFLPRLAAAGMIPWFYLYKALVPVGLTMAYPRWQVSATNPLSYLPGLLLLAALAVCWSARRSWGRPLLAAMGYFVIVLFPVLGFFEMSFAKISLVSDHLQYPAILGPIVLVAAVASGLIARVSGRWRPAGVTAAAAVVAVLAVLTYARGFAFSSPRAMWDDVLAKNPLSPEAHYETALRLTNEADAAQAAGDPSATAALRQQAMGQYDQALRLRPEYSEAHNNLGELYIRLNDLPRAGYHFAYALKLRADNYAARFNLATAQATIGATQQAAANFRRVLQESPDYPPALVRLARILAADPNPALRNGTEALALAQKACQLTPSDAPLAIDCVDTLAMAYAELGRFDAAIDIGLQAAAVAAHRGRTDLADVIQARVAGYREGKPARLAPAYPLPARPPAAQNTSTSTAQGN